MKSPREVDQYQALTISQLRDALYMEGACPECCGILGLDGTCRECGHDAQLEVEERHAS